MTFFDWRYMDFNMVELHLICGNSVSEYDVNTNIIFVQSDEYNKSRMVIPLQNTPTVLLWLQ